MDTALRLNRLSQALEYMSAACDAAPDHLPFQLRRCGLLRQAGQIARAQDLAVELHQRQPDLPGLQAELAFIAQADGRPFDCLAACSAALAQTPGDARLVLEKINALTALRRYSEALAQAEAFLAATRIIPPSSYAGAACFTNWGARKRASGFCQPWRSSSRTMPIFC
ncbi:hypothetical protein QWZ10_25110 [Paracoccus cavernae]|uniref:Tetratricopeptide repeat protein n=1 Tax=Paracoccus cavernae TaxID=1571207 RepID=A0ABT8DBS4_9RHOB|nr:hypothetical protein [Paracoccus cavernae]